MMFRLCQWAIVFCAVWGSASRGLGQCANCGSAGHAHSGVAAGGQMVVGPDGVETWMPNGSANCGRCGHTSEEDFLSKSCNDCLYNWGDEYSDISALSPRFMPRWSASADAIFLGRDVLGRVDYAALGTTGPFVLDTDNGFPIEFAAGVRGKVSRGIGEAFRVEGIYMSQLDWSQSASARDITPNGIGGLGTLTSRWTNFGVAALVPGLDYNHLVTIDYTSEMENAELNLLHRSGFNCYAIETSFVCGVRYFKLNETFNYLSAANSPAPLGAVNVIDVETRNELIGGQLGVLGGYKVTERIYLEFELKAAMCQNIASQNLLYRNTNTADGTLSLNRSRTDAGDGSLAVVGDTNLVANFQLASSITLRLGYYAMWVDGVAIAHENVTDNFGTLGLGPGFLNDNGTVVYHGPHVGLTLNW